ncbi:hypothetical protein MRB53_038630 [Persea americana]|nr:hypothetical protein MRB53_038630 [Persea americana]
MVKASACEVCYKLCSQVAVAVTSKSGVEDCLGTALPWLRERAMIYAKHNFVKQPRGQDIEHAATPQKVEFFATIVI